jgi:hypothetical protein
MNIRALWAVGSIFWLLAAVVPAVAGQDYTLTFLKEEYKEETPEGGPARIYHTWYVTSEIGDKLLVLTGSDQVKRKWLREFSTTTSTFLIQVPDAETAAFEAATVFDIDVRNIHPVDREAVEKAKAERTGGKKGKKGKK